MARPTRSSGSRLTSTPPAIATSSSPLTRAEHADAIAVSEDAPPVSTAKPPPVNPNCAQIDAAIEPGVAPASVCSVTGGSGDR